MHINLTLNEEQTESIKQSLFSVLTSEDLASGLFSKIVLEKIDTPESRELKTALIKFMGSQS